MVLWLNGAPFQVVLLVWQVVQLVENPAATCAGAVVRSKSWRWHETQVVGFPLNTPSAWHEAQLTVKCFPVRGNWVVLWLKGAPFQVVLLV